MTLKVSGSPPPSPRAVVADQCRAARAVLCVFLFLFFVPPFFWFRALMWVFVYVCVFVGLSGEPGQSVRCSNGGFKDKRRGEFSLAAFYPTPPPSPPPTPPSPSLIGPLSPTSTRSPLRHPNLLSPDPGDIRLDEAGMHGGLQRRDINNGASVHTDKL